MFSFGGKPLGNLLGAAYLTGALEALNKSKSLGADESERFFEDTKQVRRLLLERAESDGYSKPRNQIEEAKKVAKKTLNSQSSTTRTDNSSNTKANNTKANNTPPTNTTPTNTTPTNTPSTNTPSTNTTSTNTISTEIPTSASASTLDSNELMPLKNSVSTTNNKKPNVPPPILQLGGKRRRKTKKHKRRSK
jgi:hypothetical protein